MADTKLSDMTAATSPVAGDVKLYGVQSAAGVAVTARTDTSSIRRAGT